MTDNSKLCLLVLGPWPILYHNSLLGFAIFLNVLFSPFSAPTQKTRLAGNADVSPVPSMTLSYGSIILILIFCAPKTNKIISFVWINISSLICSETISIF